MKQVQSKKQWRLCQQKHADSHSKFFHGFPSPLSLEYARFSQGDSGPLRRFPLFL
ncbi:hypothetical protein PSP6_690129 [Paraburkholderia tropica]|nr:hypothetical protein PSP6_690129 [Paraburkholderia tropica]